MYRISMKIIAGNIIEREGANFIANALKDKKHLRCLNLGIC